MSNYTLQFENDFQHSYMYLHGLSWQEENHEQKILKQCLIPGTLSYRQFYENGESVLQYNFSAYERACLYFSQKKIRLGQLRSLFLSLQNALRSMEEYLLSPSLLSIEWDEIFYDTETRQFLFPLIPFKEEGPDLALSSLLEHILEDIDETDDDAVLLAFLLYQEQKHSPLQLSRILHILHRQEQKPDSSQISRQQDKEGSFCEITQYDSFETTAVYEQEKQEKDKLKNRGKYTSKGLSLSSQRDDRKEDRKNASESLSPSSPLASSEYEELDLSQCSSNAFFNESAKQEPDSSCTSHTPLPLFSFFRRKKENNDSPEIEKDNSDFSDNKQTTQYSSSDIEKKKRDTAGFAHDTRYELKKEGRKRLLISLFLMLFLPFGLFYFKGFDFLFHYLPFVILLEFALLLYASLDYLILLLSSPGSEDKQKYKTSE